MANISKEERERRKAAESAAESPAAETVEIPMTLEIASDDPSVPSVETTSVVTVPVAKAEKTVFTPSDKDLKHFQAHKLADEKKKSLDAIEQAVADSCKIAENKIRTDAVVQALAADPGDIEKRLAFLRKYGPSNVKPPKPAPTAYGMKDIDLMEWIAKYEPENFISTYGHMQGALVKRLLASIRANA